MPDGPVVYILAEPPALSQTFIVGEVLELLAQDEDVRLVVLRDGAGPVGSRHHDARSLEPRTTHAPTGGAARAAGLRSLLSLLVRRPRATLRALRWSTRWALRTRRPNELVRLVQAAAVLPCLPAGTRHLHAHFAHGPASTAFLLSTLSGLPFSFTAHARDMTELSPPDMLREKVRAAAFVVAISEHGQRHLTRLAPDRRAAIRLVRNGIDVAAFTAPKSATPVETRPPRVLTVARLVPKKGLDVLVEACRLLRESGIELPCDVVGDGPLDGQLREQAVAAGVADLVRFHGPLGQPAIAERMVEAAVFVLPCRVDSAGDQDGLPVSIVEAMAAGLPVISTPIAGVPEVVDAGGNGVLIPVDDAPALAASLRELLSDEPLRARLSAGACRTARSYDRRMWVSVLKDLFAYGPGVSATPVGASFPEPATSLSG